MGFDESYNEPERTEVLIKAVVPGQAAELTQLHYAHAGDAGADLKTAEAFDLKPFERRLVPTGVAIALPAGYVALVHPRSGLAVKQGITVLNAPGTIDAGYRGEIKVPLINLDPERTAHFEASNVTSRRSSFLPRRCRVPTAPNVVSAPVGCKARGLVGWCVCRACG